MQRMPGQHSSASRLFVAQQQFELSFSDSHKVVKYEFPIICQFGLCDVLEVDVVEW